MAVALTYPLPLADFFQGLKIETYGWDLIESMRQSQTAGGETLTSDTAVRLWECEVSVTADTHKAIRRGTLTGLPWAAHPSPSTASTPTTSG